MQRLALVFLYALTAHSAHAACIIGTLQDSIKDDRIKAVFIGTVRDLRPSPAGQVATFDVERVWHGRVSTLIVVYNHIEGSESKTLVVGNRYLVKAYTLSATEQPVAIALDARVTLGVNGCTIQPPEGTYAKQILGDAPGYPPSQKP